MRFSYRLRSLLILAPLCAASLALPQFAGGGRKADGNPTIVKVTETNGVFHLTCNGQPFVIKGAGGDGSKKLLRDVGGNSFRTWGVDNLGPLLDEAQKQGLMVTAGIWLGHKEHGFDYNNADQVADQYEKARQAILKYKDHPALLMWALGNEMEGYEKGDNAAIWSAVNNLAAMAKKLDPNHPTMTVIAEIGGDKVKNINRLCPDIDIVGINSYGGGPTLATRYKQAGGVKPFVVTEFGPAGVWESGKNKWGVVPELSSTAKATAYKNTWQQAVAGQNLSLGGYAFAWGNKQEATATWFGLLLPDGSRLGGVDALTEAWTGKPPANRSPELHSLKIEGADEVEPGAIVKADLDVSDPESDPLAVQWILQADSGKANTNGDTEAAPPTFPDTIIKSDGKQAQLRMPKSGGTYRLFAYARDNHGGAAVANAPILVKGATPAPSTPPIAAGKAASLPLVVYAEGGQTVPFIPSGYMGNAGAIKMNEQW